MGDYIKREYIMREILEEYGADFESEDVDKIYGMVINAPPSDVVPVRRGRWKAYKTDVAGRGFFYCTACHADVYDTSAYCPSCGAKMDCK